MYKVSIFYNGKDNIIEEDNPYYIEDITSIVDFESELTKYLKEKGKEFGYNEALIYVDLIKNEDPVYTGDMEQVYIYEANNINNNPNLTMAYRLSKQDDEDEIIVEQINDYKDNLQFTKKIMKIGGIISGISLTGFTIWFIKLIHSLKTTHSIKSFDYLISLAFSGVFALASAIGIGTLLGGTIYHYIDKKNLKEEELKLIKK